MPLPVRCRRFGSASASAHRLLLLLLLLTHQSHLVGIEQQGCRQHVPVHVTAHVTIHVGVVVIIPEGQVRRQAPATTVGDEGRGEGSDSRVGGEGGQVGSQRGLLLLLVLLLVLVLLLLLLVLLLLVLLLLQRLLLAGRRPGGWTCAQGRREGFNPRGRLRSYRRRGSCKLRRRGGAQVVALWGDMIWTHSG